MTAGANGAEARLVQASAGQLRSMVAGLNAVVWERDPVTWSVRFVNERVTEVLGHPVADWRADPQLWERTIHAEDRDRVVTAVRVAVAGERQDFSLTYRATGADGRMVWLHHLGHVARDEDGRPLSLHAVVIDITERHRREQAAAVLAEAGRLLSEPGDIVTRLSAVAGLAIGELGDRASVWLRGDDGRYRAVACAPAELAPRILGLPPVSAPPALAAAYEAGRAFVVPEVTDEMRDAATRGEAEYDTVADLVPGSALVAPLVASAQVVGLFSLATAAGSRRYDDADLDLAEELGQRIATTVAAERLAARERVAHDVAVALSAAGSVAEASAELAEGMRGALGAAVVTVCTLGPDGLLHVEHVVGHPAGGPEAFPPIALTAPVPLAEAVTTRRPVWLVDRAEWQQRFPAAVARLLPGMQGAAVLPLVAGGRVLGLVGLTFRSVRHFDPGERSFLLSLAGHAAVAFERAALADSRQEIADTLQHSLLPRGLPAVAGLEVTARYLPGQRGTQAGGDWYDVLPLTDGRVAVAVGDVVGNGAGAAAVMGQLRSALSMLLLEGHPPARALELLDRFAARVEGARVSTVACLLLDPATGRLQYSRAGHPPPLVLAPDGPRYLDGALGPALDLPVRGDRRPEASVDLVPGTTLLLYTDGLVERRGEILDAGLERLSTAAGRLGGEAPDGLVDRLLGSLLGGGPTDDVAVVAVRLVSRPLRVEIAAEPARLRALRRSVLDWAGGTALPSDTVEDLLLAVGEAAANAVEHAYPPGDPAGRVAVTVTVTGAGVEAVVADSGTWRPPPAHPGFRGRGLAMIGNLARDVEVDRSPAGTTVRFRIAAPDGAGAAAPSTAPVPGERAAEVAVTESDGVRRVQVRGDLDLAGVAAIGAALPAALVPGPALLDLRGLGALSSVGMALLQRALASARDQGSRIDVVLPPPGPARRALDLTGLSATLAS